MYIRTVQPTGCNVSQFILFCKTLHVSDGPSSAAQNFRYSARHLSDQYRYLLLARLAAGSGIGLTLNVQF